MLLTAMRKYKLKSSECVMIGDQKSDYLCAKKSNIKFYYTQKDFLKLVSKFKV